MTPKPTATAVVAAIGRAMYGDDWAVPLARTLNINPRTMQRVKAADAKNEDYPAARAFVAAAISHLQACEPDWREALAIIRTFLD